VWDKIGRNSLILEHGAKHEAALPQSFKNLCKSTEILKEWRSPSACVDPDYGAVQKTS
jgi:hypothetical protein